jgi:CBS domain containing-hemolysin-like protein
MEIAFVSANRLRIELDKKQGLFASRIVNIFIKNPAQFIATMLIGNNIVIVIYGITMANILEPFIFRLIPHHFYVLLIQTIVSTFVILITAEFLPKAIFRQMSNFFLNGLSIPVYLVYIVFYPLTKSIIWLSHNFIHWFVNGQLVDKNKLNVFGKTDLDHLVQNTITKGSHELDTEHEIRIFQNALDFSKVKIRDCMVPRTEIVAVDNKINPDELRAKFIETGFSKILIYQNNIDSIIGYISSKELFKNTASIRPKIINAPFVPETMNANKLLKILLQQHKSLAVVVDEFGGTSGIVTTEDIMEEIFGEIEDEHDVDEIIEKRLSDNGFIFSGKLQIEYLNEKYRFKIPESDEYDTLAGFIFHQLGRIPVFNEQFEITPFSFKILKINNKRLEIIYLKHLNE